MMYLIVYLKINLFHNLRKAPANILYIELYEAAEIPFEVLQTVMSRIINEVKGVNRVFYDLTSKPPGTIEFE